MVDLMVDGKLTSDYTVSGYLHGEDISVFVRIDSRNSHEQVFIGWYSLVRLSVINQATLNFCQYFSPIAIPSKAPFG
jgi:hypothetical protein